MKIVKNSGCGECRVIAVKSVHFWGFVALLQKVKNDEFIVCVGYEEFNNALNEPCCRWCQGHYFMDIVNAVEDYKEV